MMVQITGLTSAPSQTFTIPDPNSGNPIMFAVRYQVRTQEWYADISFGTWSLNGLKLTYTPNALMQYSNSVAFGLLVATTDGLDPSLINDWVSGRASMGLLTSVEVATVAAGIADGTITG